MARKIPPPPTGQDANGYDYQEWFNLIWRRVKNMEGGTGSEKADETAIHTNFPAEIQGVAQKATPVDADEFLIEDSADSYSKKALTWVNMIATLNATGVVEVVVSKTANYTATNTDDNIICDTSGGAFTITMAASPTTGKVITVILETAGNTLTIDGNGKNINGSATVFTNVAGTSMQMVYNGTQWDIK